MLYCSGYDFGYFVKLLTAESLPTTEETFFDVLRTWFPTIYDIKFVMRACKVLKGGLQDVADDLGVCLTPRSLLFSVPATNVDARLGYANRALTSGRVRLVADRVHILQDARIILQRLH